MGATAIAGRREQLRAHVALWTTTAAAAATVALSPPLADTMREALRFSLQPSSGSIDEALAITTANARVLGAVLLAALAVRAAPVLKPALDALVGLVVGANAVLVGIAAGTYGARALPWLIHLPLEWAAVGTALGLYAIARRRPPGHQELAGAGVTIATALATGAAAETYITPQT